MDLVAICGYGTKLMIFAHQVFNLFWRRLVTIFIAALNLAYLVENIMAMAAGLNHWHHVKWLMASVTAVFTMGYIFINLNKVGHTSQKFILLVHVSP